MLSAIVHFGLTGAFLLPVAPATIVNDPDGLGTLMPYGTSWSMPEPPPKGYHPIFVESLNRHGSRALTGPSSLDSVISLMGRAAALNALTPEAAELQPELAQLRAANERVGYGQLSTLGEQELRGIGERIAPIVAQAARAGDAVELRTSGVRRAIASAKSFGAGLESGTKVDVLAPRTDRTTLQFGELDPDYRAFRRNDRATAAAIAMVDSSPAVTAAARATLRRLFSASFAAAIDDPVAVARAIHGVRAIAPALAADGASSVTELMTPADAVAIETTRSARYFYQLGPGISGRTDSFRSAKVLLEDFLTHIDDRLGGAAVAAVFRFGHAEQVIPFAAYLMLPGSQRQQEAGVVFTPESNPFNGAGVSRLGANIQWIVYDNADHNPLVSMRYNEQPTPFGAACAPISVDSLMYALDELKRCLRR